MGSAAGLVLLACAALSAGSPDEIQLDPASRQLENFKLEHPEPIGVLTTAAGKPIEIQEITSLNTDLITNEFFMDQLLHTDSERIPERIVHAKGAGAFGYFELLNDISNYTIAEVFNGPVGKKTPIVCRFSLVVQNLGGSDVERETRGMAIKYYTKEGNLDLIGLHIPVYFYRDPIDFHSFSHSFKRNPATNLIDETARYDFATLRPHAIHAFLYLLSDYGIPKGYRRMDGFIQHALELYNKHGEKFYARINYRTDQGLANFTNAQAAEIRSRDLDYAIRDLYNAIEMKKYPTWTVEMDVIPEKDLKHLDFDPFDMTSRWPLGSYKTVTIGRLVLNENPKNFFREVEQVAFSPAHLVPGINGSPDAIYIARRLAYIDSIRNRLGINFNKHDVNCPKYASTYNRDGKLPTKRNMGDVPNYYPNSFNGPAPYVGLATPRHRLVVEESNAVDLKQSTYFYNHVLKSEAERQRLAENTAESLVTVLPEIRKRALKLFSEIDEDLGKRVTTALQIAIAQAQARVRAQQAQDAAEEKARLLELKRQHYENDEFRYYEREVEEASNNENVKQVVKGE